MRKLEMNWKKGGGLIPAIIQDSDTLAILMLGYVNRESLALTLSKRRVTFYSRTRASLWQKGDSSGHFFNVVSVSPDCDQDALLIQVRPEGPACHRGTFTCFDRESAPFGFLERLDGIISGRLKNPSEKSYTSRLVQEGLDRVAQKVGEEAIETVIAAKNQSIEALESEAADLMFHLMVLLKMKGTSLENVLALLEKRHQSI